MTPYYDEGGVTLYHGKCEDVLPTLDSDSVSLVLTDPPYSDTTHDNARTNKGTNGHNAGALVTFDSTTVDDLRPVFAEAGRVCTGWVVATMEWRHLVAFEADPPEGLRFIRFGIWAKANGMPQVSADRPAQGWEAIAFMHKGQGRPKWNGGGRSSVFHHPVERHQLHPTQKPLDLVVQWVRLFSDEGDTVLDPYAGSGTTLLAARLTGRRAVGVERDERYCDLIVSRLAQGLLAL